MLGAPIVGRVLEFSHHEIGNPQSSHAIPKSSITQQSLNRSIDNRQCHRALIYFPSEAKVGERRQQPSGILRRRFDKDIDVLREPRLTVERGGIAAHHEGLNVPVPQASAM